MKKTISVILIFVFLFSSVYGFSYDRLTRILSSSSHSINRFTSWAFDRVYSVVDFFAEIGNFIKLPYGNIDYGDSSLVESEHYICYLNQIALCGSPHEASNFVNERDDSYLKIYNELFECFIKTDGEWYHAYLIKYETNYANGTRDYYAIIDCEFSSFIGQRFVTNYVPLIGYTASFIDSLVIRDIESLSITNYVLSDIEHTCYNDELLHYFSPGWRGER